jgi:light-regulated signal transduction histidine kinase (bacteriophytochrome)
VAIVTDLPSYASLEDGLQQVVQRVRPLLGVDRLLIYRFLPDQDAMIAAEAVGAEVRPLRGELIYDPLF